MPSGTQINDVFASRIHKSNAYSIKEDKNQSIEYYKSEILAMAVASPNQTNEGWISDMIIEIKDIMEDYEDCCITRFLAEQIIEFPESCKDEFVDSDWSDEEKDIA